MIKTLSTIMIIMLSVPTFEQDLSSQLVSPCPDRFQYDTERTNEGNIYGFVSVITDRALYSLSLNFILERKVEVFDNWVDRPGTLDDAELKIENNIRNIKPGSVAFIPIRIKYNALKGMPQIKSIQFNGKEICSDIDAPPITRPPPTIPTSSQPSFTVWDTPTISERTPISTTDFNQNNWYATYFTSSKNRPIPKAPTYRPPSTISRTPWRNTWWSTSTTPPVHTTRTIAWTRPSSTPPPTTVGPPPSLPNRSKGVCGIPAYENGIRNPLVFYGVQANQKEWPWQVAIYYDVGMNNAPVFRCGGTLVTLRDIVLAAHCVTEQTSGKIIDATNFTVYLGKFNLHTSKKGVQIRYVDTIAVHPNYDPVKYTYDLAILKLDGAVPFTEQIRPACIWPEDNTDIARIVNNTGVVTGWGVDQSGSMSPTLQVLKVPIVDPYTCIVSYPEFFSTYINIKSVAFCGGWRNGSSPCNGDSGGGLVMKVGSLWYLRGVVSISVKDKSSELCDPNHFTVFTDVAQLLGWIKQKIDDY